MGMTGHIQAGFTPLEHPGCSGHGRVFSPPFTGEAKLSWIHVSQIKRASVSDLVFGFFSWWVFVKKMDLGFAHAEVFITHLSCISKYFLRNRKGGMVMRRALLASGFCPKLDPCPRAAGWVGSAQPEERIYRG